MTQTAPKTAPKTAPVPTLTDRTLPAPWGVCDACAAAPGLPAPCPAHLSFTSYTCPACAAREALRDAAEASLKALTAPTVGAWTAQWTAAGVPVDDLLSAVNMLTGSWMHERARDSYQRATLRHLSRQYPAPVYSHQGPDRAVLNVADLPMLTAYRLADPVRGLDWPHFIDGAGRAHHLHRGLDTLTVTLPDGGALLIFTGLNGATDLHRAPALWVPAELLPTVQAALSGEA